MRNFPIPYDNELIYSVIARAGIHHGITSPKHLSDEVFGARNVIATIDLPTHLNQVYRQLSNSKQISICDLIYKHTLFPLYAPFVNEDTRQKALSLMMGTSKGNIHLLLGVAASRVKTNTQLRYCSECIKQQFSHCGEQYWQRNWFLPGIDTCPEHGKASFVKENNIHHRNQFTALNSLAPLDSEIFSSNEIAQDLFRYVEKILDVSERVSPSQQAWTLFYREVAQNIGAAKGKKILHTDIREWICDTYEAHLLSDMNLSLSTADNSTWLVNLFRKHRKSFSYLEHAIVWKAIYPHQTPQEIIDYVSTLSTPKHIVTNPTTLGSDSTTQRNSYRLQWKDMVTFKGIKASRKKYPGSKIYAWLYRHDRDWLLSFNEQHKEKITSNHFTVDWKRRDRATYRLLWQYVMRLGAQYVGPRLSPTFLLSKLKSASSVSKNLHRMPLTSAFLTRYSESIAEYQIRRLAYAFAKLVNEKKPIYLTILLRQAGLNEQRITDEAAIVINQYQ